MAPPLQIDSVYKEKLLIIATSKDLEDERCIRTCKTLLELFGDEDCLPVASDKSPDNIALSGLSDDDAEGSS